MTLPVRQKPSRPLQNITCSVMHKPTLSLSPPRENLPSRGPCRLGQREIAHADSLTYCQVAP
ncbi:hypothetical protein CY34DRAFT_456182 [Suillus luteus UH-Slu-Lm8-n1]|uniref:Uncharacterized protein n=1 Tax=Suillus luteus UH-Slu-Lm8-n1 TaxID=930992 RepID=A0A0D0BST2_9AGAM|nr:hypothetical protein CY34DRAFT_456182 [Suillus luteus UH-Slu-Lm8-n1]